MATLGALIREGAGRLGRRYADETRALAEMEDLVERARRFPYAHDVRHHGYDQPARQFGMHKEPAGMYVTPIDEIPEGPGALGSTIEYGEKEFKNPLVLPFGPENYQNPGNWKNRLSAMYGGKTGKELTAALKDDGYDAVVTVYPEDRRFAQRQLGEAVDLYRGRGGSEYIPALSGLTAGALGIAALAPEEAEAAFGGVLARTADDMMLNIAQKMKNEGWSRDDIWERTGWFQGADDKWRFEIDDSEMQFAGRRALENRARQDPYGIFEGRVSDVYRDPNVQAAYGDIGDTGLIYSADSDDYFGASFNPSAKEITLGGGLTDEQMRSGLAHELQHGIQGIEGFASGGMASGPYQGSELADTTRRIYNELKANPANAGDSDEAILAHARRLADDPDVRRRHYRNLAGEVEARNVQTRLDMTPQERRMMPPWLTEDVPQSQQIVRMRGSADPRLLGGIGTGVLAGGLLAGPGRDEGEISAPEYPLLYSAVQGARDIGRRLEGSPASLLYPEGTVNWLGRLSMGERPTWAERAGVLLDWF